MESVGGGDIRFQTRISVGCVVAKADFLVQSFIQKAARGDTIKSQMVGEREGVCNFTAPSGYFDD